MQQKLKTKNTTLDTTFNHSFYFMKDSYYLGDSLVVTFLVPEEFLDKDGLTNNKIILFIKYGRPPLKGVQLNLKEYLKSCFDPSKKIYLRIASECFLGMYGDSHCDCETQRLETLNTIASHGQGIYVHLPQEAQGRGLVYKCSELELQVNGRTQQGEMVGEMSIEEASNFLLGHDTVLDKRAYTQLKKIFSDFGLNTYTYSLLTSSTKKVEQLTSELGINIEGIADIEREISINNLGEYLGKVYQKNNIISDSDLEKMRKVVKKTKSMPLRVINTARLILEDLENHKLFNTNPELLKSLVLEIINKKSLSELNYYEPKNFTKSSDPEIEFTKIYHADLRIFNILHTVLQKNYIDYVALEISRYFDTVGDGLISVSGREFKIRTSYNVSGMGENCFTRLIYKIPIGENKYKVINTELVSGVDVDFMNANPLYKQIREQDVITYVCEVNPGTNILIKEYPGTGMFLEFKGNKKYILNLIEKIEEIYELKEFEPEYTLKHIGTINKFSESSKSKLITVAKNRYRNYGKKKISKLLGYIPLNVLKNY